MAVVHRRHDGDRPAGTATPDVVGMSVSDDAPPLCERCDAVCCRLTVVVQPEDRMPRHLTTHTRDGLEVMARDEEGWCVAVDAARMCCSIYDTRPQVCRRFEMAGPYCHDVRADHIDRSIRGIPLRLY